MQLKKEYYELHGNNNSYNSCDVVVRYFGWPQVSQTVREKLLPCVSPFASDREANTKPIGLGPLPTAPLYKRGSPLGDLSESIYRVSTETLVYPISEGAGRFGSSSSYSRRYRRRPEGHRRRGDATALHRPASSSTPNSDRRDGFLHYPVLDLDLFRINFSTRCDLLLTSDPG
jgi:hypothetical protein